MPSSSELLWMEQLALAQVPVGGWPDVHLLGIPASRITFADQQRRAFNLVAALVASGRLGSGDSIAIVGGGVAGVTAAAYAAQLGLNATVFEQHSEAMMIQQGSGRWIHPNLYDWPWQGWAVSHTSFPCMNWKAQAAGQVIATLREEWNQLTRTGRVTWIPNSTITSIERAPGGWLLNKDKANGFTAVVLAIGFGEEESHGLLDSKPYWRDDDLHQRARAHANILVSGCGDGGMIDALRALMIDFRYEQHLVEIGRLAADSALLEQIKSIEADRSRFPDGESLTNAFLALGVSPQVDAALVKALKPNVYVTLNGTGDAPLHRSSSALNRFLVSALMRLGRIKYMVGSVDYNPVRKNAESVVVTIAGVEREFHHVVIRHGPRPHAIERFAEIAKTLAPARAFFATYRDVVDRTRQPLWLEILRNSNVVPPRAPEPKREKVDERVQSYICEGAHAALKLAIASLHSGVVVTREETMSGARMKVVRGGSGIGVAGLDFFSNTNVLVKIVASNASDSEQCELATGATTELLLADVTRILRNSSFLLGAPNE